MNIKEAIESVKMAYCAWESEQKDMYEVIELLQQGEKYKKMWEKLKKARFDDLNDGYILDSINTDTEINVVEVLREMDMLEQRYFPKELQDEKTTKL